jgi:hypothetical protein
VDPISTDGRRIERDADMILVAGHLEREVPPEFDYRLDESDPDVVILRRVDGTFVAAFSARGATREGIVEAAEEDYARSGLNPRTDRHSPHDVRPGPGPLHRRIPPGRRGVAPRSGRARRAAGGLRSPAGLLQRGHRADKGPRPLLGRAVLHGGGSTMDASACLRGRRSAVADVGMDEMLALVDAA